MDNLAKLRLEFLEETVGYYNSKNRGVEVDGGECFYERGCAIGRHLDKELCKTLDKLDLSGVAQRDVFNMLPENIQFLGQDFLARVQHLHDCATYWTESGISEMGLIYVNHLKTACNLNN